MILNGPLGKQFRTDRYILILNVFLSFLKMAELGRVLPLNHQVRLTSWEEHENNSEMLCFRKNILSGSKCHFMINCFVL